MRASGQELGMEKEGVTPLIDVIIDVISYKTLEISNLQAKNVAH